MKPVSRIKLFLTLSALVTLIGCAPIDLYEKNANIPGHKWQSTFKPSFTFTIKDTTSPYRLFLVVRHNDQYHYNNLFVNLTTIQPGSDSTQTGKFDLKLATNESGWLGSGMDDIYEHRILLTPGDRDFYFKKPGDYTFQVEQIMREDPLENVLNVGIRVEKK